MHIDEFIYQYTQVEVDKVERRDVLARFQNKTAIQNISVHRSDSRLELHPINSARRATRQKSGSPVPVRTQSPNRRRRGSGDFSKRHASRGSNRGRGGKITV